MILKIKNMVCQRCIRIVREELEKLGYTVKDVILGSAQIKEELSKEKLNEIREILWMDGFELLDKKNEQLIEEIKTLIINAVHYRKGKKENENYSDYISRSLKLDYKYLSNLFSSTEGRTINKFIILQKIEKVKEYIVYDQLSLSEIAFEMGYSSVAHLSKQFTNITGSTPSQFKSLTQKNRFQIDRLNR